MVEPMVPAPPVTRTRRTVRGRSSGLRSRSALGAGVDERPPCGRGWRRPPRGRRARAARRAPSVRGGRPSRMLAANSVTICPSASRSGSAGRPGVAEPVGDRRRPRGRSAVGADCCGEVDAAVVDAEPLLRVEVVPDQRAPRAADHHLTDLGRAEPVDVDVGDRAARQRQGQVADAGLARRRAGRRRGRRRPVGRRPPGRMKSRIDRSCGARSQKTSTSGWTSPRLIRTESTNRISPSSPVCDQLADLQHGRRVAVGVVGHQHEAVARARLDHARGRARRCRPAASRPARACRPRSAASAMPLVGARRGGDRRPRRRRRGPAPRRGESVTCTSRAAADHAAGPRRGRGRRPRAGPSPRCARKLRTRFGPQ